MPDLDFSSYAFAAAGSPFNRTLPDRLVDVVNAKDFGAVGDGIADDQPALEAAYSYAVTATTWAAGTQHGRRTLFIPPGTYRIGTPPWNIGPGPGSNIHIIGASRSATILKGTNDTGSIVSHGGGYSAIEKIAHLTIWNDSTISGSGAYREPYGNENQLEIASCRFIGFLACLISWEFADYVGAEVVVSYGGRFRNCIFICSAAIGAAADGYLPPSGSTGLQIGTGSMFNCIVSGFDIGVCAAGYGLGMFGNYITRCNLGLSISDTFSRNSRAYLTGASVCSNVFDRCNNGIRISNTSSGGFWIGANAIVGDISLSGDEIYIGSVSHGAIVANALASKVTGKSVNYQKNVRTEDSLCMAMRGPNGWAQPQGWTEEIFGPGNAIACTSQWMFIQCGTAGHGIPAAPVNFMTYRELELGGGGWVGGGQEGNEYTIIDARETSLGAVVAGGSSTNRYKVRYDGTNWIRVA